MEKTYIRRTSEDILKAVELFNTYHDWLHQEILTGNIQSSVDRGTFVRSQDVLPRQVFNFFGDGSYSNSHAYGPEKGDLKLREKIAEIENLRHGTSYTADNITMMPGAWAGLEFAIQEILGLEKGEFLDGPIVVIGPTLYKMFHNPISYLDMNLITYDFVLPGIKHVPYFDDDLDDIFKEKPLGIVVTNPNNPDGIYFPNNKLYELIQKSIDEGVFVIIDEIQNCFPKEKELRYDSQIQLPNVIRIDGPSKRYALAEYRVGWVIAHPDIIGDKRKGIVGRMSGMIGNAPRAANSALINILDREKEKIYGHDDFLEEPHRDLMEKEKYVCKRLTSIPGVEFIPCDACVNLTINTNFAGTDMELTQKLMKQGTLIMPASGYGYNTEDAVLRFTFAERYEKLKHALDCLERVLK